jgi:hypothetical protein
LSEEEEQIIEDLLSQFESIPILREIEDDVVFFLKIIPFIYR